ncbi:MAG: sugar ABC transporter ATP-binding protein [Phycisphaerae bacterium]|nr:sugar ABC transporter ATP-binding protein [Phycisphaerae bacterium]
MPDALVLSKVSKSFGGVRALRDVSFTVREGEVHALVGENGAGKSTLINLVAGAIEADSGELFVRARAIRDASPAKMRALGIGVIHQHPSLFPHVTVAENIAIGWESRRPAGLVRHAERRRRAGEALDRIGARIEPETEAGRLSFARQQLVEIARALASDASVVLFDEPTAGLGVDDAHRLFDVIRTLRGRGAAIVYISHRLEELPLIADRVSVLRDGQLVATREMGDLSRDAIVSLMVGRAYSEAAPTDRAMVESVGTASLLELERVSRARSGVRDVSLSIRAGEVLGIAGLVGSGRTELARIIAGHDPADGGRILVDGRPCAIRSPLDAARLGIGYLPEDRRRDGVIGEMTVAENVNAATMSGAGREASLLGLADRERESAAATAAIRRFDVRPPNAGALVSSLSGGNQQKVAIAQRAAGRPRILLLDEPTQGVDVAAKAEIHRIIREMASRGAGVLLVSSELDEVRSMSDRVGVMRAGRLVGVLDRAEATPERVMSLAVGGGE